MSDALPYEHLAVAVLLAHALLVIFVVAGLACVVIGHLLSWRWVDALWFRLLHLAVILVVVAEAWLGIECPLTTLETWLRAKAGSTAHAGGFIEHGLQAILFWHAPPWVFTTAYSLFGMAVVVSWWLVPPRPWKRSHAAVA